MNITLKIEAPELAKSLQALAEALAANSLSIYKVDESEPEKQEDADQKADAAIVKPLPLYKVDESKPKKQEAAAQKDDIEETQVIDIKVVRQKLAEKSQEGKQAEIKQLFAKYGAKKLTEVPKEHYAELLELAEQL